MTQASVEAAHLHERVAEVQAKDGLGGLLKLWQEAANALQAAFERKAAVLATDGTPAGGIARIRKRIQAIRDLSAHFDLSADLDACVAEWKALGHEFAQLSGKQRDAMVRLLERHQPQVDKATAGLSRALRSEGLLPEDYTALRSLREKRDRAQAKYQRLRQQYLAVEKDWRAAGEQKVSLEAAAAQHTVLGKLPVAGHKGPAVRLPRLAQNEPKRRAKEKPAHAQRKKLLEPPPLPRPAKPKSPRHAPQRSARFELEKVEHRVARFDHSLGDLVHHLRAFRGVQEQKHLLHQLVSRDRGPAAKQLEQTLAHLATASHRTLTDPRAGELRGKLATIDAILARVRGRTRAEMAHGAQQIGQILSSVGKDAAPHLASFRKLLDERRSQLLEVLRGGRQTLRLEQAHPHGHRILQELRKRDPALDKLVENASTSHLARELARFERGALHALGGPISSALAFGAAGGPSALARIGGAGGLGALAGLGGALGEALQKRLESRSRDAAKFLAELQKSPKGSPLRTLADQAEKKRRTPRGPVRPEALLEAFREHPKARAFASHVAKGGALYQLCESAQRSRGLPVAQLASHYLASRGASALYNTVQTFHSLVGEGYRPRLFSFGSVFRSMTTHVAGALQSVSKGVSRAASSFAGGAEAAVRAGISSAAGPARGFVRAPMGNLFGRAVGGLRGMAQQVARHPWDAVKGIAVAPNALVARAGKSAFHLLGAPLASAGHALWNVGKHAAAAEWGGIKTFAGGIHKVASSALGGARGIGSWAQGRAGAAMDFAQHKSHQGLDWLNKTGVVGAAGGLLKKGISGLGTLAKYTPLGFAVSQGWGSGKSPLSKIWSATRSVAGKAWEGIKQGYKATSNFLQSPAGQLLVTGLSLAATFIPGGLVVKTLIGAGIGAIQAISEGKDWKGVLLAAGSGALTGALPFLKLGPLAKVGLGALQGGISTLAQGGSLKDALKGAAGGAVDAFDPGAMKALGKLKSVSAAGKILGGGKLSKAEKALIKSSKFAGPLRGLEKAMSNPRFRKTVGALEKTGSKAVRGGIWVSGKAAKAQSALDKVVGGGDEIHGALSQIHEMAPGMSSLLGDNAAGHFVGQLGDWAGQGDDRLAQALEYGHAASDNLSTYRGYLDTGLGYAGVKDPAKAYAKMMARKGLREGKKGALEKVAAQKLADHRRKHPELHLAEALGKTARGDHARRRRKPKSALEKALARGKKLRKQALKVTQGVHDRLGKIHGVVGKGLEAADKVQHGLEQASALAKQGAELFGEDSDVGKLLRDASDRADQVQGYLESGIGLAEEFNDKVGSVHDFAERIPGVHKEVEHRHHLEGKGIQLRRKVDSRLARIAGLADQVTKALGDDTPMGHLAHQLGEGDGKGHDKLHQALDAAGKGKSFLKTGHALFHQGLQIAVGHHEKRVEAIHGKPGAAPAIEHLLGKSLWPEGEHLVAVSKHSPHGPDPAGLVQLSQHSAVAFGQAVAAAIQEIDKLMQAGDTKAAGDRVQSLRASSEQARLEVARAVSGTAHHPALHKEAQEASKHYLELRGHFFKFVKGLHGLAGQAAGTEASEHPDLAVLGADIGSLHVKVDALGRAKDADTPMQEMVQLLKKEASVLRGRVGKAEGGHKGDQSALAILQALAARLSGVEAQLDSHGAKGGIRKGDHELGVEKPHPLEGGRIHIDRGMRGGMDVHDLQEIDAAAMDTWIGSGEGVKLFSEVFGAFLPAEGALLDGLGFEIAIGGDEAPGEARRHGKRKRGKKTTRGGFFHSLFEKLHSFADTIAGWAHKGASMLGKGMHFAEMGMHGLSMIEKAAEKVQGLAGKAEGFLGKMGLGKAAGFAHKMRGAAGWVDKEGALLHGGLRSADQWMGKRKKISGEIEGGAHLASGIFSKAEHARFGTLASLFKSSRSGIDGNLHPEKVRLGSALDDPRRLDASTIHRMEMFLGGDFSGVRLHVGPGAEEITRRFNAEAVTVKDHIFFAPGRFNPQSEEGQRLLAHELTHVMQRGRKNLDVRTAEGEAIHSERNYRASPQMEPLNLAPAQPDFRLADGEGLGTSSGVHTAKRTRSKGHEAGGKDVAPADGEEFLEQVSGRVYELLMEELQQSFESR